MHAHPELAGVDVERELEQAMLPCAIHRSYPQLEDSITLEIIELDSPIPRATREPGLGERKARGSWSVKVPSGPIPRCTTQLRWTTPHVDRPRARVYVVANAGLVVGAALARHLDGPADAAVCWQEVRRSPRMHRPLTDGRSIVVLDAVTGRQFWQPSHSPQARRMLDLREPGAQRLARLYQAERTRKIDVVEKKRGHVTEELVRQLEKQRGRRRRARTPRARHRPRVGQQQLRHAESVGGPELSTSRGPQELPPSSPQPTLAESPRRPPVFARWAAAHRSRTSAAAPAPTRISPPHSNHRSRASPAGASPTKRPRPSAARRSCRARRFRRSRSGCTATTGSSPQVPPAAFCRRPLERACQGEPRWSGVQASNL